MYLSHKLPVIERVKYQQTCETLAGSETHAPLELVRDLLLPHYGEVYQIRLLSAIKILGGEGFVLACGRLRCV